VSKHNWCNAACWWRRGHKQGFEVDIIENVISINFFCVIYCKFWELDTDHDFLIDNENLIRYGNHVLTYRIVDRIFSQFAVGYYIMCCFCLRIWLQLSRATDNPNPDPSPSNNMHYPFTYVYMSYQSICWRCIFWFTSILSQVPRRFTSKVEGKMGYEDFVYFILLEVWPLWLTISFLRIYCARLLTW